MNAQANSIAVFDRAPVKKVAPVRVAVICDFPEENWPSMDLVGTMLCERLRDNPAVTATAIRPAMKFAGKRPLRSARIFGRFIQSPQLLHRIASDFDLFHITDHSYAHLVHDLPPGRTIVTCHDLDAFRCLLEPGHERRSVAFRAMTRRILTGLQAAAHVTCDSTATRETILCHDVVTADRLTVVHNGVHPLLSAEPDPVTDDELSRRLGRKIGACPELVHVGSTIPRKRIDVLLRIFAEVRKLRPDARLIRVGTPFTPEQQSLARALGVAAKIDSLERIDARLLGACYRRASIYLQPSEAEGFGLPVIEALACGTPVMASDIPVLREVGADAAQYCPVGEVDSWTDAILQTLSRDSRSRKSARSRALQWASGFTWSAYAESMFGIYRQVLAQ